MKLIFGEWLPDLAPQNNPGATEAKNVIPSIDGYRPFGSLQISSTALDSESLGGISVKASDGAIYNYTGSRYALWELVGTTWTRRSTGGVIHYEATPGTLKLTGSTNQQGEERR